MYAPNSLDDPSLAVPFEGKGLDPNERKVNISAFAGTIGCVQLNTESATITGSLNVARVKETAKYYDVIVVGFGATSTLIIRKLLDAGKKVLVLERGKNTNRRGGIRHAGVNSTETFGANTLTFPYANVELTGDLPWGVVNGTAGQYFMNNSSTAVPRYKTNYAEGNGAGGGSSHSYMNAFHGSGYVYNAIDALTGNTGLWAFNTVQPLMKGVESYIQRADNPGPIQSDRGTTGPFTVMQLDDWSTTQADPTLIKIATEPTVGNGWTPDINSSIGMNPVGVGFRQQSHAPPIRAYGGTTRSGTINELMGIGEVINEDGFGLGDFNVRVMFNILVNRVLFSGTKAVGVEYLRSFERYAINAALATPITFPLNNVAINVTSTTAFAASGRVTIDGFYGASYSGKNSASSISPVSQTLPLATIHSLATSAFATSGSFVIKSSVGNQIVTYTGKTSANTTIDVLSNGATLPQGTINVASTTGFAASGTIVVNSSAGYQLITYTGVTATTFTGCTGGTGTLATSGAVLQNTFTGCAGGVGTSLYLHPITQIQLTGCISHQDQAGVVTAGSLVGVGATPTSGSIGLIRPFGSLLPSDFDTAYADTIILCAGAHNTPQILQRSGVGDATYLATLGISSVINNPNVGANLSSHANLPITINKAGATPIQLTNASGSAVVGINLHGVDTIGGPYYYPNDAVRRIQCVPLNAANGNDVATNCNMYRPNSTGFIRITSRDPTSIPLCALNLLSDAGSLTPVPANDSDLSRLVAYVKVWQQIIATNSTVLASTQLAPLTTDTLRINFVKDNLNTQNHSTGTCRMGTSNADAVVDVNMKVFGAENLYCADMSVLPFAPDGNPQEMLRVVAARLVQALGLNPLPVV